MLQLRTWGWCVFLLSYFYLLLLTVAQVTNPSEGEFYHFSPANSQLDLHECYHDCVDKMILRNVFFEASKMGRNMCA